MCVGHLKPPTTEPIVQKFVQADNKRNIKALHN